MAKPPVNPIRDWLLLLLLAGSSGLLMWWGSDARAAMEPAGLVAVGANSDDGRGILADGEAVEVRTLDRIGVPAPWLRQEGAAWFHLGLGLGITAATWLALASMTRRSVSWRTRVLILPLLLAAGAALMGLGTMGGPQAPTSAAALRVVWTHGPLLGLALVLGTALLTRRS